MSVGGFFKVYDDGPKQAEDERCEGDEDCDGGQERKRNGKTSIIHLEHCQEITFFGVIKSSLKKRMDLHYDTDRYPDNYCVMIHRLVFR